MGFWTMVIVNNTKDEPIVTYVKRTKEELTEILREHLEDYYFDKIPADITFDEVARHLIHDYGFTIVVDEWDLADLGL